MSLIIRMEFRSAAPALRIAQHVNQAHFVLIAATITIWTKVNVLLPVRLGLMRTNNHESAWFVPLSVRPVKTIITRAPLAEISEPYLTPSPLSTSKVDASKGAPTWTTIRITITGHVTSASPSARYAWMPSMIASCAMRALLSPEGSASTLAPKKVTSQLLVHALRVITLAKNVMEPWILCVRNVRVGTI